MVEYIGIVAMGKMNEIGYGSIMPWWLDQYKIQQKYKDFRAEDLPRFKEITTGHDVQMGRITYESFPKFARPLSERTNHVLTHDAFASKKLSADLADEKKSPLIIVHNSFESMEDAIIDKEKVYIIGGGKIYSHYLHKMNTLLVSRINEEFPMADVHFDEFEHEFEISAQVLPKNPAYNDFYSFDTYTRK